MRRTTIYLDPELEVLLKAETVRRGKPMAELIREAVHDYLVRDKPAAPPGAGAFSSDRDDTAERAEQVLTGTGFGES